MSSIKVTRKLIAEKVSQGVLPFVLGGLKCAQI